VRVSGRLLLHVPLPEEARDVSRRIPAEGAPLMNKLRSNGWRKAKTVLQDLFS